MNSNIKIEVSKGCTDFLIGEVERLRRQNEVMGAELSVMNNFFEMINRIGPKQSQGYGEDKLWQAKKEIAAAEAMTDAKQETESPK